MRKLTLNERINIRAALSRRGVYGRNVLKADAKEFLHYWGMCLSPRQFISNAYRYI